MLFQNRLVSNKLHIIIVGCGKVGRTLTEQLSSEGHELTLIDRQAHRIQEITNLYDVMGIVGNGANFSIQKEAGVKDADLLIAVTESDELNLLCCTIARILYLPTALEITSFAHGQAELVQFKVPAGNVLCDMTVAHLGKHITNNILICAIERSDEVHIPTGEFLIKAGDIISFISTPKEARHFLVEIGFNPRQVRNTMIIGGGKATYYLAYQLIKAGIEVKLSKKISTGARSLAFFFRMPLLSMGTEQILNFSGKQVLNLWNPLFL